MNSAYANMILSKQETSNLAAPVALSVMGIPAIAVGLIGAPMSVLHLFAAGQTSAAITALLVFVGIGGFGVGLTTFGISEILKERKSFNQRKNSEAILLETKTVKSVIAEPQVKRENAPILPVEMFNQN